MKKFKHLILLVMLFLSFGEVKTQTLNDLYNEANILDKATSSGLSQVNDLLNEQQTSFFSSLQFFSEYLMGQLKGEILGNLSRQLRGTEKRLYSEMRVINKTILNTETLLAEQIETLTINMLNAVSRIPFARNKPTPIFYEFPLITTSQDETINIRIRGVNLNNKRNYILFNGEKIPFSTNPTENELNFSVSLKKEDVFKVEDENVFEVYLFKRKKSLEPFKKNFYVVPNNIARVSFVYKVPRDSIVYSKYYTTSKSCTNGKNHTKDKHKTVNLRNRGSESWIMDRASIKCWKSSGKGSKHKHRGPDKVTDVSFRMGATAKKGRAVCTCTWREKLKVLYEENEQQDVFVTFDDKNHVGQLPDNVDFQYVIIKYFGNREEEYRVSKIGGFGQISYELENEVYTVTFKRNKKVD